jgi:sugar phosphate permease
MMSILLNNVLKNVWIWGMAITYFFIYVIRQGVTSWSVFFLMNMKGVPDAATAGFMVSGLEIGGLAGSLLAGRLADGMVNTAKDPVKEGSVGKRVQVC